MKGLDEFLSVFGHLTVLDVVTFIIAIGFIVAIYRKVKTFLITKHEAQKEKDEQLAEALAAVRKYPEYRQQSIEIQKALQAEIQELRTMQVEERERLIQIEEENRRRECNKLRDRLLQNYRYYTNKDTNPTQTWSRMESEAFWEMFKDYEDAGGDGYMHTDVQPAMERLGVVEIGK